MIDKRWNVNILLCGECDKDVVNIKNVFNKIYVDENNMAKFDIVTILNAIECDEEKFGLYYFIEQIDEKKMAFIGDTIHYKDDEDSVSDERFCTVRGVVSQADRMRINECEFPGIGNYEIRVYKYDNEEAIELEDDEEDSRMKYARDEKLVATYPFVVDKK